MTALQPYEPRSEITVHDPTGGRLVAWAAAAAAANQLATSLARTSFVPKSFQGNPADATAAIILGDELGLSPLSALRSIYMISGTPALYARTMVALAMSHGHDVWTESSTDREVIVCGRRRGSDHTERVTWSIDRARKAGYTSNKKYDTDPQAMLWAKAAGEVARKVAPDVLSGVPHSVEDLELEQPEPASKVQRATRTQRATLKAPEPEFEEPTSEPVRATAERADAITKSQLTALNAGMGSAYGFTARDDKLAWLSAQLGREIGSSSELSKAEASQLIDMIKQDESGTDSPVTEPMTWDEALGEQAGQ